MDLEPCKWDDRGEPSDLFPLCGRESRRSAHHPGELQIGKQKRELHADFDRSAGVGVVGGVCVSRRLENK